MNGIRNGIIWSGVERFSTIAIQFILNIVIARLLSPDDYGIIGMLSIFIAISQCIIEAGFSNALIQKTDRSEADFSTVFISNLALSLILYFVLFISAPFIGKFYNNELLIPVLRVVGLNLIVSSLSIVRRTKFIIDLDFKTQSKISILSAVISGCIGVSLAYLGYGVWALVFQTITSGLITTIAYLLTSGFNVPFSFNFESFKVLSSFGSKLLFSNLLNTIYDNLYSLFIGKKYSAKELGFYSRADQFSAVPCNTLTDVITRVAYPLFCENQNDVEKLKECYSRFVKLSCYMIFPVAIGIATLSKPIILLLLTDKWAESVIFLQIISLSFICSPLNKMNLSLLQSVGRSDLFLRLEVIKKTLAILFLITTINFGLLWVCLGRLIYNICSVFINMYYTVGILNKSYMNQIGDWFKIFVVSFMMGIVITLVIHFISTPFFQLFGGFIAGILSFILLSKLFNIKEYLLFFHLFKGH